MRLDLKTVVGIVVTVAALLWAFWDVDLGEVWQHTLNANPLLLLLAAALAVSGMPFRALRWNSLLPPDRRPSFHARNAAVTVGFAANNVLPARVGEFARVVVLNRLTGIPLGTALGSLVLERVLDGIVIVGLLFAAMASPDFPGLRAGATDPRVYANGVAVIAGGLGAVLLVLAFFPVWSTRVGERVFGVLPLAFRRPLTDALHSFVGSLAVLRSPGQLVVALLWTAVQWVFLSLSYWVAMRAYGITEPGLTGSFFLQAVVAVAVAVPAAPGFFGVQQAAAKIALAPWGIDEARILSFSIGFHIAGWLPVTALGAWYASRLNLRMSDMQRSEEEVEEAVEHDPTLTPPGRSPRG